MPIPNRNWKQQFPRFVLVGCTAGATDFILYSLLTLVFSVHPLVANAVSRPIGGLVSFTLNKYWTFARSNHAELPKQGARYALIWCCSFTGSQALVGLFHAVVGLGPLATKIAAESLIGILSFLAQKFWAFK